MRYMLTSKKLAGGDLFGAHLVVTWTTRKRRFAHPLGLTVKNLACEIWPKTHWVRRNPSVKRITYIRNLLRTSHAHSCSGVLGPMHGICPAKRDPVPECTATWRALIGSEVAKQGLGGRVSANKTCFPPTNPNLWGLTVLLVPPAWLAGVTGGYSSA